MMMLYIFFTCILLPLLVFDSAVISASVSDKGFRGSDREKTISRYLLEDSWGLPTDNKYKNNKPLDFKKKLRVAIIVVDNRELNEELNHKTSYASITAVLNYNYARKHGYDFHYYHPTLDINQTLARYPHAPNPMTDMRKIKFDEEEASNKNFTDWHLLDKRLWPTSFHPKLNRFRGATWSKVAVFWHASTTMAEQYDLIFYLDSDASITSIHGDKRVEEMVHQWQTNLNISWGVRDLSRTSMIFFPNTPFGDAELATGALIFRPKLAAPLFKEWWDNDRFPFYDFNFEHEQSVAIKMIFAEKKDINQNRYNLSFNSVSMVSESQFPSFDFTPEEWCFIHGWICHICSSWIEYRHHIFRKMLGMELSDIDSHHTPGHIAAGYRATIALIKETEIQFDVLPAVEAMALWSL